MAQLAAAAELSLTDTVLEIGPGSGNLTVELARRAGAVIAVETDRDLEPVLAANLSEFDNIQVIWGGDFLEQSLESLWQLAPTGLEWGGA